MTVAIPDHLEPFIESVIHTGTFRDPAEVVTEALRLLAKREKLRQEIAAGVEQLDRGEYTEYGDESLDEFLDDIRAEQRRQFPDDRID